MHSARALIDDEPFIDFTRSWSQRGTWPTSWVDHPLWTSINRAEVRGPIASLDDARRFVPPDPDAPHRLGAGLAERRRKLTLKRTLRRTLNRTTYSDTLKRALTRPTSSGHQRADVDIDQ